jgi:hypothetical protein
VRRRTPHRLPASTEQVLTAQRHVAASAQRYGASGELPWDDAAPFVAMSPRAQRLDELGRFGPALQRGIARRVTAEVFSGPVEHVVGLWAQAGGLVATYRFSGSPPGSRFGACHCIELPFLFSGDWADAPCSPAGQSLPLLRRRCARHGRRSRAPASRPSRAGPSTSVTSSAEFRIELGGASVSTSLVRERCERSANFGGAGRGQRQTSTYGRRVGSVRSTCRSRAHNQAWVTMPASPWPAHPLTPCSKLTCARAYRGSSNRSAIFEHPLVAVRAAAPPGIWPRS